jgi:hypothetical protein
VTDLIKEDAVAVDPVERWVRAVRVLALLSVVLLIIAIAEGRALRNARAELQQLRTTCQQTSGHP